MVIILWLAFGLVIFTAWFLTRAQRGQPKVDEQRLAFEMSRDGIVKQLQEIVNDELDGRLDWVTAVDEKRRLQYELAQALHALDALQDQPKLRLEGIKHRAFLGLILVIVLSALAGGMDYWQNKPALETFVRLNARGQVAGLHGLPPMVLSKIAALKRYLRAHPGDTDGWLELARANVVLGKLNSAQRAYAHAYVLAPDDVNVLANYAWLLYTLHPTRTTGLVDQLYRRLYAREPNQQDALWFLGLASYQRGDYRTTLRYWRHLERELPPGSKTEEGVHTAVADIAKRLASQQTSAPTQGPSQTVAPRQ